MVETETNNQATQDPPPPRAFAQGVGILFQTVGCLLFMSTCCVCSTSFLWDPIRGQHETPADINATINDPARRGLVITIMAMSAGGAALAAFGLGMQSDRRKAVPAAMATCSVLLVFLIAAAVNLWSGDSGIGSRAWNGCMIVLQMILLGFAIGAWRDVKRNPPSGEPNLVPYDYDPKNDH